FRIGQKRKWQLIFPDKLPMTLRRIDTYPENLRLVAQLPPSIPQTACLNGASGRIVFRIKIEHDRAASKISERDFFASTVFPGHVERHESFAGRESKEGQQAQDRRPIRCRMRLTTFTMLMMVVMPVIVLMP